MSFIYFWLKIGSYIMMVFFGLGALMFNSSTGAGPAENQLSWKLGELLLIALAVGCFFLARKFDKLEIHSDVERQLKVEKTKEEYLAKRNKRR